MQMSWGRLSPQVSQQLQIWFPMLEGWGVHHTIKIHQFKLIHTVYNNTFKNTILCNEYKLQTVFHL